MAKKISISEQMCYCTTRIDGEYIKNGITYTTSGTGFFYKIIKDNYVEIPLIITNKHVVENLKEIVVRFSSLDDDENPVDTDIHTMSYSGIDKIVRNHPDKDVDLCAIPFSPILNYMSMKLGKFPYYHSLTKELIPTPGQIEELYAGEDVIMIGYPDSIYDTHNNKPIFRKGITATDPKFDYQAKKEFLVDIPTFGGSSGSPIMIINIGMHSDKHGTGVWSENRHILLGINYSVNTHKVKEKVVVLDDDNNATTSDIFMPNGLAHIIKAERILELEKLF